MALTLTLTILLVNGETLERERFKLLKLKNCVHLKQKKKNRCQEDISLSYQPLCEVSTRM